MDPLFDPAEPFRKAIRDSLSPLSAMRSVAVGPLGPRPGEALFSHFRKQVLGSVRVAPQVDLLGGLREQLFGAHMTQIRSVIAGSHGGGPSPRSEQMARVAVNLAASTAVRLAADPDLSDSVAGAGIGDAAGGAHAVSTDEMQAYVHAAVRQLTGDRPEGWRWLLCTGQGLATLVTIIIGLAGVTLTAISVTKDDPPSVVIQDSPGADVTIFQAPDSGDSTDDQPGPGQP